ncbi:hypothetical protein E2C01_002136 [Portunus trituberculatus]|uniref:Uncharacterized protein n=1 Tax=Portunus trituberculatus TaxID=210409 RepID=A0A5B7CPQ7_PORTR|nr:hypothetical protein [Portunus trituberculatus]
MADMSISLARNTSNVAFMAGSSKHGKARRASVGWNCVTASHLWYSEQPAHSPCSLKGTTPLPQSAP